MFVLVGVAVAFCLLRWVFSPSRPGPGKALSPTSVALRHSKMRAHEVRCALLPDCHPFHSFRSEMVFPVPLGDDLQISLRRTSIKLFGFEMLVFVTVLVVGFTMPGPRARWNGNKGRSMGIEGILQEGFVKRPLTS